MANELSWDKLCECFEVKEGKWVLKDPTWHPMKGNPENASYEDFIKRKYHPERINYEREKLVNWEEYKRRVKWEGRE